MLRCVCPVVVADVGKLVLFPEDSEGCTTSELCCVSRKLLVGVVGKDSDSVRLHLSASRPGIQGIMVGFIRYFVKPINHQLNWGCFQHILCLTITFSTLPTFLQQ